VVKHSEPVGHRFSTAPVKAEELSEFKVKNAI